MKKIILLLLLVQIASIQYAQIIADHTVVNHYDDIPQEYINEVKKMLLVIPGESHANGYFEGLLSLEDLDPAYQTNWSSSGAPDGPTSSYLRVTKGTWGSRTMRQAGYILMVRRIGSPIPQHCPGLNRGLVTVITMD